MRHQHTWAAIQHKRTLTLNTGLSMAHCSAAPLHTTSLAFSVRLAPCTQQQPQARVCVGCKGPHNAQFETCIQSCVCARAFVYVCVRMSVRVWGGGEGGCTKACV